MGSRPDASCALAESGYVSKSHCNLPSWLVGWFNWPQWGNPRESGPHSRGHRPARRITLDYLFKIDQRYKLVWYKIDQVPPSNAFWGQPIPVHSSELKY